MEEGGEKSLGWYALLWLIVDSNTHHHHQQSNSTTPSSIDRSNSRGVLWWSIPLIPIHRMRRAANCSLMPTLSRRLGGTRRRLVYPPGRMASSASSLAPDQWCLPSDASWAEPIVEDVSGVLRINCLKKMTSLVAIC